MQRKDEGDGRQLTPVCLPGQSQTEEPGELQSMRSELDTTEHTQTCSEDLLRHPSSQGSSHFNFILQQN